MDKTTLQQIAGGDRLAYELFYKNYFRKFCNYGRKFTADLLLIEDSIQEVFLDIWLKQDKLLTIASPPAYFLTSFRYTLLRKMEQASRTIQTNDFGENCLFFLEPAAVESFHKEGNKKIQTALQSLTSRQKEAVFLRFYEELSYEDVAAVMNITVKACYKIIARSLASLRDNLSLIATAVCAYFI